MQREDASSLTLTRTADPLAVWSEDWLTLWLGFLVVLFVLAGVRPDLPSFRWVTDGGFAATVADSRAAAEKLSAEAEARGGVDVRASAAALVAALEAGNRADIARAAERLGDAASASRDAGLKGKAGELARRVNRAARALPAEVFAVENIRRAAVIGIAYLILSALGIALAGGAVGKYFLGFPVIYALAWFSQVIGGNSTIHYWGLEYVIFALAIGLVISNVIGVPDWLLEAVRTDYYIKTGLVMLGASVLFFEILQAGAFGIVQAILVVSVVWYSCFWLARRLRVDDEFAVMLATAVSICGVSAAIAACGAIQGDRKKLSYVTSLVLMVAVPMMVLQPWIAKAVAMPDLVAGAWLGGTLDTSGAVVAAGALISEPAMKAGVIVKFSQNVLIGVAAFILSLWWSVKKGVETGDRTGAGVIWERFPKFVLGFLAVSVLFSFLLDGEIVNETKGLLGSLRTVWFAMAFTCIGLETRFTELFGMGRGRPALAFAGAQAFNVVWTLLLAYLLFGGVLFPVPVLQ